MEKILLIDGSSLIFRAFFAIRNLTSPDGVPTGAVYGFMNMYKAALDLIKPDYVLVAFDKAGPTLRTRDYSEYKGTRDKTPDELLTQFGMVRDLLDSYGVKHIALDDYEADDIIGTLSKEATKKGIQSYMLTGDRDYFQLVDETSHVLYTVKGISNLEIFDVDKIKEKYDGLSPEKLIEIKGLMGDSSDNIPGVPGVGEKTAIKLIKQFETIEGIYEHIDEVSGKALPKNLIDNEALAYMSRKLGRIYTDVDLDVSIEDLKIKEPNRQELYEKYKMLGFSTFTSEFAPEVEVAHDFESQQISMEDDNDIESYIRESKKLVFDIAFDGDYLKDEPRYIGIKGKNAQVLVIDLKEEKETFIKTFKVLFEDKNIEKISFDIKKNMVLLERLGIRIDENYQDLLIAAYLINPNGSYSIQDMAMSYASTDIKSLEDYIGKGKKKLDLYELDFKEVTEYLTNNLFVFEKSYGPLLNKVEEMDMTDLLLFIDLPLIRVLADMELTGIETHKEEFEKLDIEISERLASYQNQIYEYAGEEFNINSPKQLGVVLFEKLDLPVIKKTKTGYSTNADVLAKLMDVHPIIKLVEQYRSVAKLKSTYIDGLIPMISDDGRIHSKFNQTVAATGRLSSTDPNLQNIPIKTEEGRLIRSAFFASEGNKLVAADYSQIELRVLAALTKDKNMMDAFEQGIDIHTKTASEVFDVDLDKVTRRQRSDAKAVNFGIVYGISDYSLSEDLDISRKQAKEYIDGYLESYPNISAYMKDIVKTAKNQGYVETMFKRRRYIPEIKSSNFNVRSFGERIALNTPIQGTAADIIKTAMINVTKAIKHEGLKAKLILQIHDELIFDTPDDEVEKVSKILQDEMENAVEIGVDLLVEVEVGETWYEV